MYLFVTNIAFGMDKSVTELPVLRLSLLGFTPPQEAVIEAALSSVRTALRWRLVPLPQADALCANGARAVGLPDGSVHIGSAIPGEAPARIDITGSERPLAFCLPVALRGIQPHTTFDINSSASIRAMLDKFEGWLRPMAMQFCLAAKIIRERLDVGSTVFHVSVNGRLQAVVSRRNGIGVLPIADPVALQNAVWARRPVTADDIPAHFVRTGLAEVMWLYAMRSTREMLAPSFRSGPIYWCRAPQLPQRLFDDSHLMIVRELARAPATFSELSQRTRLPDAELSRALVALCIGGSISNGKRRPAPVAEESSYAGSDDLAHERTAPAPLTPQWI